MKNLILALVVLFFFHDLNAQTHTEDDIALIQDMWGKGKKDIVSDYMKLTPAEEVPFWKAYDEYEISRKKLGRERLLILNEYDLNQDKLNGTLATDLVNRSIDNNIDIQKLFKKTYKSMSKAVSPVRAAQFMQLENYLLTAIQMDIQDNIPFIGDLNDSMKK
jgi:hypothetical protein